MLFNVSIHLGACHNGQRSIYIMQFLWCVTLLLCCMMFIKIGLWSKNAFTAKIDKSKVLFFDIDFFFFIVIIIVVVIFELGQYPDACVTHGFFSHRSDAILISGDRKRSKPNKFI